jgi:predicted dehydrogenase
VKALVVGGGSIGTRHLRNLKTLGINCLALVEPETQRQEALCREMELDGFRWLDQALNWDPDFAIIASPTHLHAEQALEVARRGCHLFVEKPLSHMNKTLEELAEEIGRRGLISLVGCNMRFHPGPAKVKELLEQEVVGKLLFARVHTGSYLPGWRPWQDYRKSYSANAAMGGGCLLDCIHEIDLTRWYIGEVEEVFCVAGHLSSLEMDVEDVAALICKHANGTLSEIHLDYVQRTYERGCQIVGEQGSIFWDYNEGTVRWFDAGQNSWKTFAQPKDWQVNQMYVDELKHFLECVRAGRQTTLPVSDAVEIMRVVFAAKTSADSGCLVCVEEERLS